VFKVRQKAQKNANLNLCEGKVTSFLGTKEGIDYYKADLTICFDPSKIKTIPGEIALDSDGKTYLPAKPGRMLDVTETLTWSV
jgi:hypothetical protein